MKASAVKRWQSKVFTLKIEGDQVEMKFGLTLTRLGYDEVSLVCPY